MVTHRGCVLRHRAGGSALPLESTRGLRVHKDAGSPSRPEDRRYVMVRARQYYSSSSDGEAMTSKKASTTTGSNRLPAIVSIIVMA